MYTDGSYDGERAKHGSTRLLEKAEAVLSWSEGRPRIYPPELLNIVQGCDQSLMGLKLRVDSKEAIKVIRSTQVRVRCRQLVEEAKQSIFAKAQRLKHEKAHATSTGQNNADAQANRACDFPPPKSQGRRSPWNVLDEGSRHHRAPQNMDGAHDP